MEDRGPDIGPLWWCCDVVANNAGPSSSRFGASGGADEGVACNASTRDVRFRGSLLSAVAKSSTSGRQRLNVSISFIMEFICAGSASSLASAVAMRDVRVGPRANGEGGSWGGGGGLMGVQIELVVVDRWRSESGSWWQNRTQSNTDGSMMEEHNGGRQIEGQGRIGLAADTKCHKHGGGEG
jgi:hypothetical protein